MKGSLRGHMPNGVSVTMDLASLGSLSHLLSSFTLDDSSLALIALLAGMAAGWTLTNWRDQQLRAKKLKANRKS
jgi:hypothetical protein